MSERFDHAIEFELASGYVLDSLSAEDESWFETHLDDCLRCQAQVTMLREVAARLGQATQGAPPSPSLRDRIVSAAIADRADQLQTDASPWGGPFLDSKLPQNITSHTDTSKTKKRASSPIAHPHRRMLVGAAAVVIALSGVFGAIIGTQGGSHPSVPCSSSTCTTVVLTSPETHRRVATVTVDRLAVFLRPQGLRADNRRSQIYVLWDLLKGDSPRAIGGFDVQKGSFHEISVGDLRAPKQQIVGYAISLEHGRSIPKAPTHVIAIRHLN